MIISLLYFFSKKIVISHSVSYYQVGYTTLASSHMLRAFARVMRLFFFV